MIKKLKKLYYKLSIQYKIFVICFIIVTVALVPILFILNSKIIPVMENEIGEFQYKILEQTNINIKNFIEEINYEAYILYTDEKIRDAISINFSKYENKVDSLDYYNYVKSFIFNLRKTDINFVDFTICGTNNQIYSTMSYKMGFDFMNYEPYLELKNSKEVRKKFVISKRPYEFGADNRKFISFIRLINDPNSNKQLGYIICDIDTNVFYKLVESNKCDKKYFIIFDDNSNVLFNSVPFDIYNLKTTNTTNERDNFIYTFNNKRYFVTYLKDSANMYTTFMISPESLVYRNMISVRNFIYILIFISLCLSLFLAAIFSRAFTKPIRNLKHSVKSIESNNFDIYVKIPNEDEIGELAKCFNDMSKKIKTLIESVYKAQILKKESQIKSLQAQINPHFLFNTMQVISSIAEIDGNKKIPVMCRTLSDIFRYNMNFDIDEVYFNKELEHVKNYLKLLSIRYEDKIKITYNIDKNVYNYKILKHIFQPIVENAVQHGLNLSRRDWKIKITAKVNENYIIIKIVDNGIGMSHARLNELKKQINNFNKNNSANIGLANVNKRIILKYGSEYGININSLINVGTVVTINFPIRR